MKAEQYTDDLAYWKSKLHGMEQEWHARFSYPVPAVRADTLEKTDSLFFSFPEDLADRLCKISAGSDYRLHILLMAAWAVLVNKYTGDKDFLLGTTVFGPEEKKDLVNGLLPVRCSPGAEETFKSWLLRFREELQEAVDHQHYPYREMERLFGPTGLQRFYAILILGNVQHEKNLGRLDPDLLVSFKRSEGGISGEARYKTTVYAGDDIREVLRHYKYLLNELVNNVDRRLCETPWLETLEIAALRSLGSPKRGAWEAGTALALIEKNVRENGTRPAVADGTCTKWTYEELDRQAVAIACRLANAGIGRGDLVALWLPRAAVYPAAMLATWKLGAAFLPLDTNQPGSRVQYLLEDAGAGLVLSTTAMLDEYPLPVSDVVLLDDEPHTVNTLAADSSNPDPGDIAYVIYTSGSTGRPKGVAVPHRALHNYLQWLVGHFVLTPSDKSLMLNSPAFDLGYTALFGMLACGGSVVMANEQEVRETADILFSIQGGGHTFLKTTPSYFGLLMAEMQHRGFESFETVRYLFLGGEQIRPADVRAIMDRHPAIRVVNHYGPTETAIGTVFHEITTDNLDAFASRPVIGSPIGNAGVLILDDSLQVVPGGIIGELYIEGPGLASGYWKNKELTDAAFLPHPYEEGHIIYKTGDRARWTNDGTIEFLGRKDHQYKLNGYRVELEEILKAAEDIDGILKAVPVLSKAEGGRDALTLFYTTAGDFAPSAELMRDQLRQWLPHYMIPHHLVKLDQMPLTPNGKVDRQALLDHESATRNNGSRQAWTTAEGEILREACKAILGVEAGPGDNFFVIGGDSINAIQLASFVSYRNLSLKVADIYRYPRLADMSLRIRRKRVEAGQGAVSGPLPMTPAQHRFFDARYPHSDHWNQAVMLFRPQGFNPLWVRQAAEVLLKHHDALRTVFREQQGRIEAEICDAERYPGVALEVLDLRGDVNFRQSIGQHAGRVHGEFDLGTGPLLRLALYHTDEGDHLQWVSHHLVIDTVSYRILLEDFSAIYAALENQEPVRMPDKTTSLKNWLEHLQQWAGEAGKKELGYWQEILSKDTPALKTDRYPTDPGTYGSKEDVTVQLSPEDTHRLLSGIHHVYGTDINDVLLSALSQSLGEWTGDDRFLVRLEGHGREAFSDKIDISRTVGWFTSEYPVVLTSPGTEDPGAHLRRCKEMLRKVPAKGCGYGVLRHLATVGMDTSMLQPIRPDISFNYLGRFEHTFGSDTFSRSHIFSGAPIHPGNPFRFKLELIGVVLVDGFYMQFNYHPNCYDRSSVERLAEGFRKKLLGLIDYCEQVAVPQRTPSDLVATLEEKELEWIYQTLEAHS